jgi:hypothetical protein
MKSKMPIITLLAGAAAAVVLLVASMLSAHQAPARSTTAATAAPASTVSSPPPTASPRPTATALVNVPSRADYAGEVNGGGASVAIAVHGSQAIAYVCNGYVIEAWLKGTATAGKLDLTGKNHARLKAAYRFRKAVGYVLADGTRYTFSAPSVHKPSGLYESIAIVAGAKIKAGWIVLPDGQQVGSIESNADSAVPSATRAPALDVATGTAREGSSVLVATPVSGVTGSGF